jgi:hypothetical protein
MISEREAEEFVKESIKNSSLSKEQFKILQSSARKQSTAFVRSNLLVEQQNAMDEERYNKDIEFFKRTDRKQKRKESIADGNLNKRLRILEIQLSNYAKVGKNLCDPRFDLKCCCISASTNQRCGNNHDQLNSEIDGLVDDSGRVVLKVCSIHKRDCADPHKLLHQKTVINRCLKAYRDTIAPVVQQPAFVPAPLAQQPAPVAQQPAPVAQQPAPVAQQPAPLAPSPDHLFQFQPGQVFQFDPVPAPPTSNVRKHDKHWLANVSSLKEAVRIERAANGAIEPATHAPVQAAAPSSAVMAQLLEEESPESDLEPDMMEIDAGALTLDDLNQYDSPGDVNSDDLVAGIAKVNFPTEQQK